MATGTSLAMPNLSQDYRQGTTIVPRSPWQEQVLTQPAPGPAPPGYTWDPVQKQYTRTVGAAEDVLAQRTRAQQMQDQLLRQQQSLLSGAMTGLSSAGGGGGGSMPQMTMPSLANLPQAPALPGLTSPPGGGTGAAQRVPQIQPVDLTAAQEAAFGRAKDRQGEITRSALSGLQSSLAGRGMLGSGLEAKGMADIVQRGAGELGNLTREQAIQRAEQAQRAAEMSYQGGITQRGQDIQSQQAAADAALRQWQAQTQAQLAQQGMGLDVWRTQQEMELQREKARLAQASLLQNTLAGLTQLY